MRPAWPYIGEVVRSLLGVLLVVAVALAWGAPGSAMAAGGSAALVGATALRDNPRRLRTAIVTSVAAAAAAFLGSSTASVTVLSVVTVVAFSAAAGLMWAVSAEAGLVAAALGVLLVGCSHQPVSAGEAGLTALLALTGGLSQVVLVAAWPRRQWQAQQAALDDAYRSVAAGARDMCADPKASLDVAPLFTLRDTHTSRALFGLPERIAMTLTALRAHSTRGLMAAAADTLDALGRRGRGAQGEADRALAALDAALDDVPNSATAPARRLRAQLREATSLRFGTSTSSPARLSWSSPIVRHAIRLAGAVGVGTVLAAAGVAEGYWIALTILLVMRPETAHTYTRCVVRVVATVAGIAVASSITVFWHPTGLIAVLLAVLFVAGAYAIPGLGYAPVTAALSAAIVFLVDMSASPGGDILGERLLAATLGGALAVASHVVFPDRSLVRLHQRAGELLKAEIDYAATVIRGIVHPTGDAETVLAASWDRAARARSAFEAASGSARADTAAVRRWLTTYRASLNAVTASCAVLERHLASTRPGTLDRRFVVAVDDFVDALRGEAPRAGKAWTLDATHLAATEQQLRDSAAFLDKSHIAQRVLVAEVETITRHLMSIADSE